MSQFVEVLKQAATALRQAMDNTTHGQIAWNCKEAIAWGRDGIPEAGEFIYTAAQLAKVQAERDEARKDSDYYEHNRNVMNGEWSKLREKNAELSAQIALAREALGEIREVWAGAECGEPVHAQEAYAIHLCKQMYGFAATALSTLTTGNDEWQPGGIARVLQAYRDINKGRIGEHWAWVALTRIAAGEDEREVMQDYGFTTGNAVQAIEARAIEEMAGHVRTMRPDCDLETIARALEGFAGLRKLAEQKENGA